LALGGQDIIFRSIIKTDNMKTVLEQLMELKDKINAIEIAVCGETICGDGACGCGCDESPVEVVDETPKSAISQYVVTEDDKYAGHVHLTRVELIDFSTRLTERVIESIKKAVTDMELNADDLVTLELNGWSNTIEVELDNNTLANNVNSEIEDAVNLDADSISDEIDDIFGDMYLERIS
jgi:hypothetical protein